MIHCAGAREDRGMKEKRLKKKKVGNGEDRRGWKGQIKSEFVRAGTQIHREETDQDRGVRLERRVRNGDGRRGRGAGCWN